MSKIFNFPERDVQALHRLQDLARVRAEALRGEAIADFWRGAGVAGRVGVTALRAALRGEAAPTPQAARPEPVGRLLGAARVVTRLRRLARAP